MAGLGARQRLKDYCVGKIGVGTLEAKQHASPRDRQDGARLAERG